jgi:predicted small integral membrane protein
MTAAYYLVVAFDNITNPPSNWVFVQGVLEGDGLPRGTGFQWREIDVTWFQVLSYVGIIAGETLTGLALAVAGFVGLRRTAQVPAWVAAQRLTLVGCTLGLLVFFFGFITVGGNWLVMYLNAKWNGLEPAFQNSVMTVATALVVLVVAAASQALEASQALDKQSTTAAQLVEGQTWRT